MRCGRVVFPLFLVGVFSLAGCSPKDIRALEGRIFFSVQESYRQMAEGVEPSLYLSMETEKAYECCNYSIVADYQRAGAVQKVDIRGIEVPVICLTAFGPARGDRFLELEEGVYTLEFRYGPLFRSVYKMTISREAVAINQTSGLAGLFTVPKFTVWWRYPRNSFAVICGTTTDKVWIYEDFLGRLRAAVDLTAHIFPPAGEIGYPRAPQGHQVNHPARYFVYRSEADFAAAGAVLRAYVRDVIGQTQGVSIWLLNWKNESFRSWMMGPTP